MIFMRNFLVVMPMALLIGCAGDKADPARPAPEHLSMTERLNQSGGYKQEEDGSWVPKSDKRSSYDSQRDSPYFKGKVDKATYKTGDYAKKSWWGGKDYGTESYAGNTDGSRFQTAAQQQGEKSRLAGQQARIPDAFQTNTLDHQSAREAGASGISRPLDAATQVRRDQYKAPSVINWREQREMSIDQSRGILGR